MLISVVGMFSVIAVSSLAVAGTREDDIPIGDDALIYDNDDLQSFKIEK
jgi:hypothetical protein